MTKVDVITGFLGAGKTTFLKKYVNYLLSKGERICILEFDYGAVNVDMMLLQEFNDSCDLEMVAGGCDYDCHLRRFKTKLIAMGMKRYDRVIIEPSGIFDTDEFFDTLYDEPLDNWYEIGSVVSIVDPTVRNGLSLDAEYILTSQIASSGRIIISKSQNYSLKQVEETITYLDSAMNKCGMKLYQDKILVKPFDEYNSDDFELISRSGYSSQSHEKKMVIDNNDFNSVYLLDKKLTLEEIKDKANHLFNDLSYGKVLRIKGFFYEDKWFEFNMTRNETTINKIHLGQDVVIIIGENLVEDKINNLFEKNND